MVELLARADTQGLAAKPVVAEVSASLPAEEALALEEASLCLLLVAYALHQFWVARLLHPT